MVSVLGGLLYRNEWSSISGILTGESIVVDPNGKVIKKAGDQEEIIYVDIDLSDSKKIRESRPYTQLRRTKFYR